MSWLILIPTFRATMATSVGQCSPATLTTESLSTFLIWRHNCTSVVRDNSLSSTKLAIHWHTICYNWRPVISSQIADLRKTRLHRKRFSILCWNCIVKLSTAYFYLSAYLPSYSLIYQPMTYQSIYIYLSICLSVCLSICLSACMSICLPTHLSIYIRLEIN